MALLVTKARQKDIYKAALPERITGQWLVRTVPGMDYIEYEALIEELDRRGWEPATGPFRILLDALRTSKP